MKGAQRWQIALQGVILTPGMFYAAVLLSPSSGRCAEGKAGNMDSWKRNGSRVVNPMVTT
jgi:hypothetical protein